MPIAWLLGLHLVVGPANVQWHADGSLRATLEPQPGERVSFDLAPTFAVPRSSFGEPPPAPPTRVTRPDANTAELACGDEVARVRCDQRPDGCRLAVTGPAGFQVRCRVTSSAGELLAARVALDAQRQPTPHGGGDVLEIAVGRAASRRCNAVYTTQTFRGALIDGPCPTELQPIGGGGYACRLAPGEWLLRELDVWPILGWRPASAGSTYGHPESGQPHIVPREWMQGHRPFPWQTFSPVQLPYISMTDPQDFAREQEQLDYLADNLRDWGFYCYGEWPLSQHNPEYAPPAAVKAYLDGNRRTCDYAHAKGLKVLRWTTDPDLDPRAYPELHAQMKAKGWLSLEPNPGEWLLDYTNPDVQRWIERVYADLAATGPDFYWIDNNHPTRPIHEPKRFPPEAFREFYRAIQRGLLSTGRNDILIRSGASEWADYAAAGILDVYAPGPDIQNDWTEQQLYAAQNMASLDYLCHFSLWRRGIDDFFPAGPQTLDQTRAMGTLLGLTGICFTTTDIGFARLPPERLDLLRKLVPIAVTRPLDLYRFNGLPRWWVQHRYDGGRAWAVAGVFNWGLRSEETACVKLDELGLDPANEYLVYDFWSQQPVGCYRGAISLRVAPTTGRALAIYPVDAEPHVIATDRHVTMGATELANLRWDARHLALSGEFVAGVKGRTFRLTGCSTCWYGPTQATVDGRPVDVEQPPVGAARTFVMPLRCGGPRVPFRVQFTQRPLGAAVLDEPRPLLGDPAEALRRARAGETVVLESPWQLTPEVDAWQAKTGLSWGLFGEPVPIGETWLTVAGAAAEPPDDLLYRSSCVGFQPATCFAVGKRIGRGAVVVTAPHSSSEWWQARAGELRAALSNVAASQAQYDARTDSILGNFTVNAALTEGTAPLCLAPALAQRHLSFHFRRLSRSLIGGEWEVPRVSLLVNGRELPHKYNPCRPESPPQEWDSLYFLLPDGILRGEGKDTITVRSARPAKHAAALAADLRAGVELCVEDAADGRHDALVPPRVLEWAPPDGFDALLGLDGGCRYVRRAGAVAVSWVGAAPPNGWPLARPGGVSHCLFSTTGFTVQVQVPKGSRGTLEVFAYDYEGVRTEDVAFNDGGPQTIEHFADGRWLRYPFTEADSRDGELRVTVSRPRGGNAVLSRVRLRVE